MVKEKLKHNTIKGYNNKNIYFFPKIEYDDLYFLLHTFL